MWGEETFALSCDAIDEDMLSYDCDHCEKKFLTENILNHHTRYYHQKRQRKNEAIVKKGMEVNESTCKLCYVDFKYPTQLERHKGVVHKYELDGFDQNLSELDLTFSCEKCDQKFWSAKSLEYHTEKNHPRFRSAKRPLRSKNTNSVSNSTTSRQENFQYSYMLDFVNTRRSGQ